MTKKREGDGDSAVEDDSATENDGAYEVGYGRPPIATRFPKGRSGNPAGRPRGARGFSTVLQQALRERVAVVENGRTKRVPKLDIVAKQLVNKAAKGDARATEKVIDLINRIESAPLNLDPETLSQADEILAREMMRRMRGDDDEEG